MHNLSKVALLGAAAALTTVPRAVHARPRADANDPKSMIVAIQAAFEEFKTAHAEQMAKKADVVVDEKVDRINSAVSDMQSRLDELNRGLAALKLNGSDVPQPRDPEYSAEFEAYFKRGVESQRLEQVRAAATKTDGEGGYLAPVEWDRTVAGRLKQVSAVRQYASVQVISGAGFSKVFSDRNTGSGWVGEQAGRPATATPGLQSLSWPLGELYANPAASQGLIDDAEVDIAAWLASEVSVEFERQEGIAFLSGDGTNKPHGLLTYVTGGANAARHPFGAIAAVPSGAAAALTGDGILNLVGELPSEYAGNAAFYMNRGTTTAVRKLKDGQNNYLWQPAFAVGQPATLNGEPVRELPAMPALAANAVPIIYGDMAETYLVVDRIGVRILRDPYTNKPFVHFYTTKRVGGGVKNPDAMKALRIAAA
jgi:HK97 family phage major capsid protein